MHITHESIESILGQSVVLSWTELRGQTCGKNGLSGKFGQNSDTKCDPGELECIAEDVEISSGKDEHDNSAISDARGTRVLPGEKGGEEGVVVSERLSGSSLCAWSSSGSSEI